MATYIYTENSLKNIIYMVYKMNQKKTVTVVFATEDFERVVQEARKLGLPKATFIRLQTLKAIGNNGV